MPGLSGEVLEDNQDVLDVVIDQMPVIYKFTERKLTEIEVKYIAIHVGLRHNVLITYIGKCEPQTCISGVGRNSNSVVCSKTSSEESRHIVRNYQIWTLCTVEIA